MRLAAEEATRIWKSASPPDIILSLGTGIWIDNKYKYAYKPPSRIGRLLPKGIKKKIETRIDEVVETLDCHREWTDFSDPLCGRLERNCYCLNVGLYEKPPDLDEIEQLENLRHLVSEIALAGGDMGLQSDHVQGYQLTTKDHLTMVVQRLVGSLFFLSISLPPMMRAGRTQSTLHFRLSRDLEGAAALISELSKTSFHMLEVHENGKDVRPVRFRLSADEFEKATMSVGVELDISDGCYERIVEVKLPERLKGSWHPIGGF